MKKMYLALIVGAMGLASCTEQPDPNKLHLTGSLENMGDTLIAQVMSNEGTTISTDTILVKNGQNKLRWQEPVCDYRPANWP